MGSLNNSNQTQIGGIMRRLCLIALLGILALSTGCAALRNLPQGKFFPGPDGVVEDKVAVYRANF